MLILFFHPLEILVVEENNTDPDEIMCCAVFHLRLLCLLISFVI